MSKLILFAVALLAAAPIAAAPHAAVTLGLESSAPAPGKPLTIALRFAPQPGWHTYWKNPGDAGIETQAAWTLPDGAVASPLRYPVPGTLLVSGLMNYVYDRQSTLLATIAVPADLQPGTPLPLRVKLDYLICTDEMCVPETANVSAQAGVGDGAADPAQAALFTAARQALPKPLTETASYAVSGSKLVLAVPLAGLERIRSAYFFPARDGIAKYSAPQKVTMSGDRLRIETEAGDKATGSISGVLRIDREGEALPLGFEVSATLGTTPAAGTPLGGATAAPSGAPGFLTALLLAIAGGVLLNVMPCVFPILSLKALSLAKGGASEASARRDALAYAAGVIAICVALGGLILALRAAGTQVGWAFQLQSPHVILALLLLTTAIAFNLAGLFELGTIGAGGGLASKPGAAGSFWTGALAAFVATPCTGPFMAGALGAALVLPPVASLAVFAGLGFGVALPFLAIGFVPALRRRLPRPGAWMATFRHILSVPMFLTALALAWVLGRQAGIDGMTLGLAGALAVTLMLWWLGRAQSGGGRGLPAIGGAVLAAVVAVVALPAAAPAEARRTDVPAGLAAEPFSEARLAALRSVGTPAFVYFTADWCLTCKVNERGALADASVAAEFKRAGVEVLVGDWTSGDPALGRFIESHNRAGVPLYLFYPKGGEPRVLPQLLTASDLTALAG